jgi:hypothetical protein
MLIDLLHHFDDCGFFLAATQDREHRGQQARKLRIYDTAPYGKDDAIVGCRVFV